MLRVMMWLAMLTMVVLPVRAQDVVEREPDLSLLWSQVRTQPDDFAVACIPLNSPGGASFYNRHVPMPLASVSKLLIFIEYARRIDAGDISLNEQVAVVDLNRYDLDRTDRGAHDNFMREFGTGKRWISLYDVAIEGMMQYSSNAASDYLLERLEPVDWDGLYALLGMDATDYPHPIGMIPLLMNNHETGRATSADVESLSPDQGLSYFSQYVNNARWRDVENRYRAAPRQRFPDWEVQAAILDRHTAVGTVDDFANVMQALYRQDSPLPESVRQMVRAALRWGDHPEIDRVYREFGSKLGFYSGGTLALVAYGQPLAGEPVVSVTFMRNIPRDVYRGMLENDSIGDLAHWMNFNECVGILPSIIADTINVDTADN